MDDEFSKRLAGVRVFANFEDDSYCQFREASAVDEVFIDTLLVSSMIKYVFETWVDSEERWFYFQNNCYKKYKNRTLIIEKVSCQKLTSIGRLSITGNRLDNGKIIVNIDNIHLLKEFQKLGIGMAVFNKIFEIFLADEFRLAVLKTNPALNLYRRLGFVDRTDIDSPDEARHFMMRS